MKAGDSGARLLAESGWPAGDPRYLTLLPLVYISWSLGDPGPEGIERIAQLVDDIGWSEQSRQEILERWLNASRPPDPVELRRLLSAIRGLADSLPLPAGGGSLIELGIDLAELGGSGDRAAWATPEVRHNLAAIEGAIGVDTSAACRELLTQEGRRPEVLEPEPPASFDLSAMTRLLGGAYRETRQQVLDILRSPMFRYRYGLGLEGYRERVLVWCRELARRGLGAAALPPEYGGSGDVGRFIVTLETLGFHDLSLAMKFAVQFGLFAGAINRLGSERQRQRFLRQAGTLDLPGCFAMSEAAHGSNVRDIETEARFDSATGQFIIHTPVGRARKDYVGNAGAHGRMAVVFAQLEVEEIRYGVHAFLVPIRDEDSNLAPGVRIRDSGEKAGLNGLDNGAIWFDHVRIPRENLLSRFAYVSEDGVYATTIPSDSSRFYAMLGSLADGRIGLAGVSLSAAKSGLTIAIRYAARRRQFGPPGEAEIKLLDYQAHQRRLMPLLATSYALDFALKHLVRRFLARRDDESRDIQVMAAGLKAYSSWFARDALQHCREGCGGAGYMAVNRLGGLRADCDALITFQGDNTVLMQHVARSLFAQHRQEFEESRFLDTMKQIAGQAARKIAEINPIVIRMTDDSHLRDSDFHLGAFRYREAQLIRSVTRQLERRMREGVTPFEAFNECQSDLLELANAYVERGILEQFVEAVNDIPNEDLVTVLRKLCDLFALSRLEADMGWFLESGYLDSSRARAIRRLVGELSLEVRQQAVPLVDALGIPDELLGAPIALRGLERRRALT
jgi:acyl-CoA oxidase